VGTRLGRYDILRTLFKGELTDLLLARSEGMEGFQRHVAIKRLHLAPAKDKACLDAFVNEARLAAALHHHNIVQVLDIGEDKGQPYFAMEYVHGVDLRALLNKLSKRGEQLPLQHVVSIIAAAAAALHHAHEQKGPDGKALGIVHRDVTPGNILVGFDGNVKVVDFGIAKAAIKRIITDQGVLKGRVPYMAPEQCAGKPVDRRSDVFALGIVAYELATVRRLFKGATEFLTMSAIVNAEIPKPSRFRNDVPAELEQIMLKALARDPADRYQTAGEMAMALDAVAIKVGVGASTTQLANYMRLQFGTVKEPWLVDEVDEDIEMDSETTDVDFDGAAAGLAPPAAESVKNNAIPRVIAATRSSPIAQVRNIITPAKAADSLDPSAPVSSAAASKPGTLVSATRAPLPAPKKPVPMDKSYSLATAVDAPSYDRQSDNEDTNDSVPTKRAPRTAVASPPPPPANTGTAAIPAGATVRRTPADATEIVVPLPVMPTERPVYKRAPSSIIPQAVREAPRRLLWVAGAMAVVVVVAAAVVLWPSNVPAVAAPNNTREIEMAQRDPVTHEALQPEVAESPNQEAAEAANQASAEAANQEAAAEAAKQEAAAEAANQASAEAANQEGSTEAANQEAPAAAPKQEASQPSGMNATMSDYHAAAAGANDDKQAKDTAEKATKDTAETSVKAEKSTKTAKTVAVAEETKAKPADDKQADDAKTKAVAAKIAKRNPKSTPKPATKRPTKSTPKKTTKKGAKWNPDELFLGD
jgi:serine/threonine protein kinase